MVIDKPSVDVRLARIDEKLAFQAKRADERHSELLSRLDPLVTKVQKHEVKLAVHGKNWKWLYGLAVFAGGAAGIIAKHVF